MLEPRRSPSLATGRITFLDGLRGWGALFVLFYHLFVEIYPVTADARGQLFRLLPFNGGVAVMTFFIVSGFSLSVAYRRKGDRAILVKSLAGRYFRLTILLASVACSPT